MSFQADESFREAVVGLSPVKEKHEFFIDVVPEFGFPLAIRLLLLLFAFTCARGSLNFQIGIDCLTLALIANFVERWVIMVGSKFELSLYLKIVLGAREAMV